MIIQVYPNTITIFNKVPKSHIKDVVIYLNVLFIYIYIIAHYMHKLTKKQKKT